MPACLSSALAFSGSYVYWKLGIRMIEPELVARARLTPDVPCKPPICSGGTLVMMSTPPLLSSLMRAVASGMGRKTTCCILAGPLKWLPTASMTNLSFGVHVMNLYGPVPIGALAAAAGSAAALGGSISTYDACVSVITANGSVVLMRTVYGSTTTTSDTGL